METLTLPVQMRDSRGKNEARRLRATGLVPAVLYGYNTEALTLAVNYRELRSALSGSGHSVMELAFPEAGGEPVFAVVKEIQSHPTKRQILHIDLLAVNLNEEIESPVAVELVGLAVGVEEGGVVDQPNWEVTLRALPRDIPASIQLDVSALTIGDSLTAADLELPDNVTLVDDPATTLVSVLAPQPVEEEVPAEEEGLPEGFEPEVTEAEGAESEGEAAEGEAEGEEG